MTDFDFQNWSFLLFDVFQGYFLGKKWIFAPNKTQVSLQDFFYFFKPLYLAIF